MSQTSVQRYTDTAVLGADLAALPERVRDFGLAFLHDPTAFISRSSFTRVRFSPGSK